MKQASSSSFVTLAASGVLAISALSSPAFATNAEPQEKNPCAAVHGSSSASAATGTGSQGSTVVTTTTKDGSTSRECRVVRCGPSSSVTTGPDGLSGSTSMPGGSSVTVQTGKGVSGSSVGAANRGSNGSTVTTTNPDGSVTITSSSNGSVASASSASSSGGHSGSSAAGAGQDEDCVITVHPTPNDQPLEDQNKRKP
jgi:hypothetical protein